MAKPEWATRPIKNILLDISGVLFETGVGHAIDGSVEAIKKIHDSGYNYRLVTNECTSARARLAQQLNRFGFETITEDRIVSPAPVACRYLLQHNLRPRLHIYDGVRDDFKPVIEKYGDTMEESPNCLVVGDIMNQLSRDYMDASLELMVNCQQRKETPQIISLGAGRYYKEAGRLRMDSHAYVTAFEYCLGVKSITLGKPAESFFQEAMNSIDAKPQDTIMIGDDVVSDVGGAQKLGMRGFLVRTGKYKPIDETDRGVKPDHVFDNLLEAVNTIVGYK